MKRAVAALVFAFVASTVSAGQALAVTCTQTGFFRDNINLTAAMINPGDVTGTVDATGCNIGVYYGPGSKAKVTSAEIFGANYFGIVNNGGDVDVKNSSVHNIGETPFNGTQHGVGIYFVAGATGSIHKNTVSLYQKGGIVVTDVGSSAKIQNNTVTGLGPVIFIAQNGIQVSRGATGDVNNNTVSGNAYSGPNGASSGGVLIFGGCQNFDFGGPLTTDVDVKNNTLINNDVGIFLFNADAACNGAPATPTNNSAHNNTISNDAVTNTTGNGDGRGYQAGIDDVGNRDEITNNTISGAGYKARDDETALVVPIDTTLATDPRVHNNHIS
jgi:parallel beta helix pectate lyase-like protein